MNQATLPGPTVVQTLGCMTFLLHPSISESEQMLTYSSGDSEIEYNIAPFSGKIRMLAFF